MNEWGAGDGKCPPYSMILSKCKGNNRLSHHLTSTTVITVSAKSYWWTL